MATRRNRKTRKTRKNYKKSRRNYKKVRRGGGKCTDNFNSNYGMIEKLKDNKNSYCGILKPMHTKCCKKLDNRINELSNGVTSGVTSLKNENSSDDDYVSFSSRGSE
jgi:hypothetical protein